MSAADYADGVNRSGGEIGRSAESSFDSAAFGQVRAGPKLVHGKKPQTRWKARVCATDNCPAFNVD
jgi:hypothetical protein